MMQDGEYAVWFRTPRGEGTGNVILANGRVTGGDSVLTYSGSYQVDQDRFTAVVSTKRHAVGQPTVFGIDEVELEIAGTSTGTTAFCTGIAKQTPDLPFRATLSRAQTSPASSNDNEMSRRDSVSRQSSLTAFAIIETRSDTHK